MPIQYLLSCPCGELVKVAPRQAGDRVQCTCGAELEVPPLRRLRELPQADASSEGPEGGHWGLREGLMAVSLIACLLLSVAGGYLWLNEPPGWQERSTVNVDNWTPQLGWQYWCMVYRPLTTGDMEQMNSIDPAVDRQIQLFRLGRWVCLGLAAVAAAMGLFAAFSLDAHPRRG